MKNRFGGRPRSPRQQVRDQRVVTFLTGDERRSLERFAEAANVSVSRACHDLLLRGMEELGALTAGAVATQRSKK